MFSRPLWDRDPMPDIHSLLSSRSRQRHRIPPLPEPRGMPTSSYQHQHQHQPREHRQQAKQSKQLRIGDDSAPSSAASSSSEWELDAYTLHHDDEEDSEFPRFAFTRPRLSSRRSLEVRRASVNLPRAMAASLRTDDLLLLPPLTHLRIRIRMRAPYAVQDEVLRAAAPETMLFGDVVRSVMATYFGEGVKRSLVTAYVRQRGQWREVVSSLALEEMAPRGEVFGDGCREVEVNIDVGNDGERERARNRLGGRGPRGSAFGIKTVLQREESRFRVGV